jgi:hypothetical protein
MTPEETREAGEVMIAASEGKQVQYVVGDLGIWAECEQPTWQWCSFKYRLKPEPKLRPWTGAEGLGRMVRRKSDFSRFLITEWHESCSFVLGGGCISPESILDDYEELDRDGNVVGPCGVEVEG